MEKDQEAQDEKFIQRCLLLAVNGRQNAKPNPMVGAVIVNASGRIIGEGYHVRCGEGHAEVNAFASVRPEDERFLPESTIYVSLEPCSHYGRTPPCCDLIIRKGVRRVVCGCIDPFAKVHGRGVKKIRAAGIDVTVNVLEKECRHLNKRFMTFNTLHRPYVILKWAQSVNGFMDDHFKPVQLLVILPGCLFISSVLKMMQSWWGVSLMNGNTRNSMSESGVVLILKESCFGIRIHRRESLTDFLKNINRA